jgi:hypothetical protein
MPQSIVVSEGISLSAVKVETAENNVEFKAEAKAVAPATIEANVVKVGGYIRPFYM